MIKILTSDFGNYEKVNGEKITHPMNNENGIVDQLKDKFEFIVVTSRNDFESEIAIEKLNQIGLKNIQIFSNEHHKIERLISEGVDYIIDDDEQICINAADNNIHALYLKNNASNRIDKEKVINVNNWGEIYKYLVLHNK